MNDIMMSFQGMNGLEAMIVLLVIAFILVEVVTFFFWIFEKIMLRVSLRKKHNVEKEEEKLRRRWTVGGKGGN